MMEKKAGTVNAAQGKGNVVRIRPVPSKDVLQESGGEALVEAKKVFLAAVVKMNDNERDKKANELLKELKEKSATLSSDAKMDYFFKIQCSVHAKDIFFRDLNNAAWNAGLRGFVFDPENQYFSAEVREGYAMLSGKSFELVKEAAKNYPDLLIIGGNFYFLRLAELNVVSEERRNFVREFKPKSMEEVGVLHASYKVLSSSFPDAEPVRTIKDGSNPYLRSRYVLSLMFGNLVNNGSLEPVAFGSDKAFSFLSDEGKARVSADANGLLAKDELKAVAKLAAKFSSIPAAEAYRLLEAVTRESLDKDLRAVLAIPENCQLVRSMTGFTLSLGQGENANGIAIDMATMQSFQEKFCDYSICVYDSSSHTYAVLLDSSRKIIVRDIILTEGKGSWKDIVKTVAKAMAVAEQEKKKGTKFSHVLSKLGSISLI